MDSVYHILDKFPILEEENMPIEMENLAKEFVKTGLLRIDAGEAGNFVRIKEPTMDINSTFSRRQLEDPILFKYTKKKLLQLYSRNYSAKRLDNIVDQKIAYLTNNLAKLVPINYEKEMKIARIIIQSVHPCVLLLMMLEGVEVYFSYGYNIGDVLDVVTWQEAGQNSGMQSTDGLSAAVFVSCGGDPLRIPTKRDMDEELRDRIDESELEEIYGDGKPAQARAVIVGAQEMGHFSDMIRDSYGRYAGRHSAVRGCSMPSPKAKKGRNADLRMVFDTKDKLYELGLLTLKELERKVKFFRKNKIKNFARIINYVKYLFAKLFIFRKINKDIFPPIEKYLKERYPATMIDVMLYDMIFNLEPKADVYANKDKDVEEAIACIEALARVPQQERKWGKSTVSFLYPNLSALYNKEVIPRCIRDYETLSGRKYTIDINHLSYLSWYQKTWLRLKKSLKKFFNRNKI